MAILVIAVVAAAAIAAVAWPYFAPVSDVDSMPRREVDPVVERLAVQRDAAYAAIKDLEFDHAMGKLSNSDYGVMRARYETKAFAILQDLDHLKAPSTLSSEVEGADDIEREIQQLRRGLHCPKCNSPISGSDAFCAKCGTSLRAKRCPTCGTRAALGDKFCARCGSVIAESPKTGG